MHWQTGECPFIDRRVPLCTQQSVQRNRLLVPFFDLLCGSNLLFQGYILRSNHYGAEVDSDGVYSFLCDKDEGIGERGGGDLDNSLKAYNLFPQIRILRTFYYPKVIFEQVCSF